MRTRQICMIPLFLCITGVMQLFAQQKPEPLPIDPKVRYGKLENGLTYYIRHNELPKERADFYIAQNVGSILEEENQRGLAHFLEHMAFNGSKNFPDNGMDDYAESIGMRMGENINAYTSFDETVYMLKNAPVTTPGVIDTCLLILHDWSNFLTLPDSMIEKERGIIREEWRTQQDAQARLWEQQLPKMYPDSRYGNRMPIGTIEVIDNFKPQELRDYYHKWYRPDLQGIIVSGDINVDEVEQKIKALFSDIPAPVNPAERVYFEVADNDKPLVSIAKDKESPYYMIYIFHKHDKMPEEYRSTAAGVVQDYIQSVSATMMNERLNEIVQQADPPFIYAGSSDGDYMISKTKSAWMVGAVAEEGRINDALESVVMETERVRQHGFTASEYERARINVLKEYESAYNERENQPNDAYTREYVNHFTDGGYIPGIETEYAIIGQIAPNISVEQINQYMKSILGNENIVLSLTGPDKEDAVYPTEDELAAHYESAREIPVLPYQEVLSDEPLIPQLPAPGKVVRIEEDPRFGATVMTLSNGIRVILKHTEFKKDEIVMTATSPGGSTLFDDKESSNLKIINEIIPLGGLGNFSAVDLGKALAGKKVSVRTSLGLGDENVNASATPADIKTLFELVYLNFTAPRMDNEAFTSYTNRLKAQLANYHLNPMVAFSDTLSKGVYNNNPRAMRLTLEDFDQISYERMMQMYKERFADASDFVFTFVGNLDKEAMRPLIEQYLATLPAIQRKEQGNLRHIPALRKGEYANRFNRQMETPKASVSHLYWGLMDYTLGDLVSATMLKQILDIVYTEKVREDEGGTYGVQTSAYISHFPEGQTMLQIFFDTDPEKREKMNAIIVEELRNIAANGPRQGDFSKTKDHLHKRHGENLQENSYWLDILDRYYYKGFDSNTTYVETLDSITPETIRDFAKKLLDQDNHVEVVMEPLVY